MLQPFSRPIAKSVPHVIAAGKAGGMVIVTRFKDLSMMQTYPRLSFIIQGSEIKKPVNATIAIIPTNFSESLQNLNFSIFGQRISRTNAPFVVRKPVLRTRPITSSLPTGLVQITDVPPNRVCLVVSVSEYNSVVKGRQAFITGMDSPVSIASFTIALPVRRIKSHGSETPYGIRTTSPGSNSRLQTVQ